MFAVLTNFFAMDGYGIYIWPAWALGLLIVLAITISSIMLRRSTRRQLAGKQGKSHDT